MRASQKMRLFGFFDEAVFHVLWFDREHAIVKVKPAARIDTPIARYRRPRLTRVRAAVTSSASRGFCFGNCSAVLMHSSAREV